MKTRKFILLILFCFFIFPLFAIEDNVNVFLTNYFSEEKYSFEIFQFQNGTIIFAYFSNDNNGIIQKAILFEIKENCFEPMFYIKNNEIFNNSRKLVSPVIKTQKFYGWKVFPQVINDTFFIYTSFYTDNGVHVTDGVTFILKNNSFEKYIPENQEY